MAAFPTTRWSLIRASQQPPRDAAAAWSALVQDYRPAIVAYFRRGTLAREAEDLAQEFLLASMQDGWWARADSEFGSFRRFLLALLKRFLANRSSAAQHRLEQTGDIDDLRISADSPEAEFDLQFALCLTRSAFDALQQRYAAEGKTELFQNLQAWLGEPPAHGELAALAARLAVAPNTLAVQLKRLRQRFRQAIEAALAELCEDRTQRDADLTALRQALAGRR
ncbi:hypothetical protein DFR29_104201 [Tahibacter aquaticus]|uniref:RNA polymerase sigma-70 factor (ECF subfamily) n=1 Tax=Tahibacter aquaticus TaxID=520092 RepID=A0A4R6Z2G3_9GAMM|nr:sigma-70 family RNA polymerase sigma factor [Tahibacter aquaticus]TDR45773.1 hypothetical protein DFR29_104201 [Tahibacter aquaticus]